MYSTGYEGRFYTGFGGVFVHRIRRVIYTQEEESNKVDTKFGRHYFRTDFDWTSCAACLMFEDSGNDTHRDEC